MIDDVTTHATLTSYSLTVMCHLKKQTNKQQRKIFEIFLSGSRVYTKYQTSAIIREIPDINLETGRYGSKSGVSRIIRES